MKITSGPESVTPAQAKKWLEDNYADNRKISKSRVDHYRRQMDLGHWRLNGEPLIFCSEGHVLNGQHRLKAVIAHGKTVEFLITRGVDASTFTTMDQVYGRTGAQVFTMRGHTSAACRAAICRALISWETKGGRVSGGGHWSPDELLLCQELYSEEINQAVRYAERSRRELMIPGGFIGLAHILFSRARVTKAPEFLQVLSDGVTAQRGHPAVTFRRRMMQDKLRDRLMPNEAIWCALVRAWNTWDQGKTMSTVQVKRGADGQWIQRAIRGLTTPKKK